MDRFLFYLSLFPWGKEPLAAASTQGWQVSRALMAADRLDISKVCFFNSCHDFEIKWRGHQRPF
jgi:hypothetical protein